MRKRSILLITLVLAAAFIFSGCGSQGDKPAGDVEKSAKKYSINFVPMKIENEPLVSFKFLFHTGSMNDPEGKSGLAYLTVRMLSDGGTLKNSYQEILKKLYPISSSYGGRVDREYTVFSGQTHKDNLDRYYVLLKEALLEPGFKEEDFNRLKSQSVSYLKNALRYSSDEELGKAVFKAFAYRGTPYEKNVVGTVAGLEAVTLEDVKAFYKANFGRDNLTVGISGNYPDTILDTIDADFSQLPDKIAKERSALVTEDFKGLHVTIVEKPGDSTGIHIGFPIKLMRGDADFHALFLANSWMGEHRNSSSHLYQVIRERRGMNYGDYSYIEDFPNGGRRQFPPSNIYKNPQLFEIWIRPVENNKRFFAFRAALRELQSLVDNGLSQEAFDLTKKFMSKYYLHFAPSNSQRLGYKLDDGVYGMKESYLDNFRKHIDALTLEKVNAAIKKHLQYENLKIVFVTSDAEKLKEALVNNTPSPITYRTPKPAEILEEDKIIEAFPVKILPENITIIKVDDVFK